MEKQLIIFGLNNEEYGIDILQVKEIIRMQDITKIPNCPSFVEGIINLRGTIIPIVHLKKRFNMEYSENNDETRIIIVNIDSKLVGFVVDKVLEVKRIDDKLIEDTKNIAVGIREDFISGIVKLDNRLIILLDFAKILTRDEKDSLAII